MRTTSGTSNTKQSSPCVSSALIVSVVSAAFQVLCFAGTTSFVLAEKADSNQVICRDVCDRYWRKELSRRDCYPALKEPPAPKIYMSCLAGRKSGFDASCQQTCLQALGTMMAAAATFDSHPACRNAEGGLNAAVSWCRKGYETAIHEVQAVVPGRAIQNDFGGGVGGAHSLASSASISSLLTKTAIVVDGPDAQTSLLKPALSDEEEDGSYFNVTEQGNQEIENGTRLLLSFNDDNDEVQLPHRRMLREEQASKPVQDSDRAVTNNEKDDLTHNKHPHANTGDDFDRSTKTGGKNFQKVLRGRTHKDDWGAVLSNQNRNSTDTTSKRNGGGSSASTIKRATPMDLFLDAPDDLAKNHEKINIETESTYESDRLSTAESESSTKDNASSENKNNSFREEYYSFDLSEDINEEEDEEEIEMALSDN